MTLTPEERAILGNQAKFRDDLFDIIVHHVEEIDMSIALDRLDALVMALAEARKNIANRDEIILQLALANARKMDKKFSK
jgi:Lhr-like helicase